MNKIYLILIVLCFTASSYSLDSISVSEGVIVDQKNELFYLMSAEKNLIALKSSGKELWQSPISAKPLFLEGEYLISMKDASAVGVLKLVILRTSTGAVVSNLDIALPKTVMARIDDSYDQKFDLEVRIHNGLTYLVWGYIHKKSRGSLQ